MLRFIRLRPASILVAEDDPGYGCALAELLTRDGHRVRRVTDGEAAIRALQDGGRDLDLLVLDLLLPRRSGFEVVREVVAMGLPLPMLAMTGVYANFREIHALRAMGVRGYVHKSSPLDHVLFRVNTLLYPARDEQRVDRRVAASVPVAFRLGDRTCQATTFNLSVSGLYVRTHEPVLAGAPLDLELTLPTAREVVPLEAEVVHSATPADVRGTAYPAGFGARFVDASPLARAALRHYVDQVIACESELEPAPVGAT